MQQKVPINRISSFLREYGAVGNDQLAIRDFVICENQETINTLRAELVAVANNKVSPVTLDKIVGKARQKRFTTYKGWAKTLLMWLAENKG